MFSSVSIDSSRSKQRSPRRHKHRSPKSKRSPSRSPSPHTKRSRRKRSPSLTGFASTLASEVFKTRRNKRQDALISRPREGDANGNPVTPMVAEVSDNSTSSNVFVAQDASVLSFDQGDSVMDVVPGL